MNWEEVCVICQNEVERLERKLPDPLGTLGLNQNAGDLFLQWEQETNEAIEVAVRQFAAKGKWPSLTPRQEQMLWFRLDFAASLASLLAQQPRPWEDHELEDQRELRLSWLMLFAWSHEGFPRTHRLLMRSSSSDVNEGRIPIPTP
jgi:hypothetical protein